MLFNSLQYLVFFPLVVLLYYVLPWQKARNLMLLAASFIFYMCWNPVYIILMLGCITISYLDGRFIEIARREEKTKVAKDERRTGKPRTYLVVTAAVMIAVLVYFKYAGMIADTLTSLFGLFHIQIRIPENDVILPVGISFFTFQALSYDIDVYRGEVECEHDFLKFALFISFFPQLVAGPIERSGHLLHQFDEKHPFNPEGIVRGLMMMLWGYFMKVVIADRISIFVGAAYSYYNDYEGLTLIIATFLFGIQIYCDFAGYTNIAIGSAQVLGINLIQNFEEPYLAVSVADFWRRWHISLTNWFRDYVYFPLGGSRCSRLKHYRNIMIVFLISGLWHGASWTYVIWGGLNGLWQVLGDMTKVFRKNALSKMQVKTDSLGYKLIRIFITLILVDFTWIFFRAPTVSDAIGVIKQIGKSFNPWVLFDGTLYTLGLSSLDYWLMIASILILLAVDILHEKKISIRTALLHQPAVVRWIICYGCLFAVIVFGVYGPAYNAESFIYFQF